METISKPYEKTITTTVTTERSVDDAGVIRETVTTETHETFTFI